MFRWGIILLLTILTSACSQLFAIPTPVDDGLDHYLWIGDDQISTGPLDMQILLLLELAEKSQNIHTSQFISPWNTFYSAFNQVDFIKNIDLSTQDIIFIQAFGLQRNLSKQEYVENAKTWIDYFQSQNKKIIIFYPWFSMVDSQADIEKFDRMVHEIAWQYHLTLVPVGPAWRLAQEKRPDLQLYGSDGIHPSAAGLYLTACVFFASMTGESPVGNPVFTSIGYDHPADIVKLDGNTVDFLQNVAWETMNEYLQKDEFQVMIDQ